MPVARESVEVLPNGQGDTGNRQYAGPGDQYDRACAWREQVIDSQAHQCVRSTLEPLELAARFVRQLGPTLDSIRKYADDLARHGDLAHC